MLGYVDTLTGGSISKLGIFSLGIVPYINSSIIFQVRDTPRARNRFRSSHFRLSQSTGGDMT